MKAPISLTARLSLLFAGSAACVLLVAGLLFEHAANNRFQEQDREELDGKMEVIREVLKNVNSQESMDALPLRLRDTMSGHPGIAITIAAKNGGTLFSTGEPGVIQHLLEGGEIGFSQPVIWPFKSRTYRIVAKRLPIGIRDSQPANVAIALDISSNQQFMTEFKQFLWFGMAQAALAMGWLAWVAVRQGLAPLNQLSTRVANVSAQRLDKPIPKAGVPLELQDLVAAFNTMLARLDESFQRLSEFSSDIAHELRTPIQNLMVQTEVILTRERDAAEYRGTLQSNLEEFERLSRMISNMLFLAKADNRLLAPHMEPVELNGEAAQLLEFYEALASEHKVRISAQGNASVQADRMMIQRALSNLLSNAISFTPEGMTIEVEIKEIENAATISVSNPGAEIRPEHLNKIFDRLYRVDASRREGRGENVGLGLAITKSIVEMHGGAIGATSSNGRTCFTISLPLRPTATSLPS